MYCAVKPEGTKNAGEKLLKTKAIINSTSVNLCQSLWWQMPLFTHQLHNSEENMSIPHPSPPMTGKFLPLNFFPVCSHQDTTENQTNLITEMLNELKH